jgi:hypothetical protein
VRVARFVLAAATFATLAGCARRETEHAGVDTTAVARPDTATASYAPDMILDAAKGARVDPALTATVRGALREWAGAWRYQDPAFRLDSLRWRGPDTCRFVFDESLAEAWFTDPKQQPYTWQLSPDGTRALIPDAYREWDPHSQTWGREPETVTALVDVVNRRWTRVTSCGTSCTSDAGAWLDSDRFVIAGQLMDGLPQMTAPQVLLFDVKRGLQWSAIGPMIPEGNSRYDNAIDSLTARHTKRPA